MEVYYFCCMPSNMKLTYFNNNIAELDAPKGSFMLLGGHIGSFSDRNLPFLILSRQKQNCGGKLISLSISQSPLPNAKNPVNAMFRKTTFDLIMFDKWVGVNCTREKVTEVQLMKCK